MSADRVSPAQIHAWLRHALFLVIGAAVLYRLWPFVLDVVSTAPRLATISPGWIAAMVGVEGLSFVCAWWLIRIALPRTSWFLAATSQLVANAVSRTVPGAAAAGGATMFRMLAANGQPMSEIGGALAATSVLSTAALFAIPAAALLLAVLGAPIPEALEPVAGAGAVLFLVVFLAGAIGARTDRPLLALGAMVNAVLRRLPRRWRHHVDPADVLVERDRILAELGDHRWPSLAAAVGNWVFNYLALVCALWGVGAEPRLSLVLLAYAGGVVMSMIPLTPGGFGFVEATLVSLLVLSGISTENAALATLAYRLVTLLVPVAAAVPAWIAYRRRYRWETTSDEPAAKRAGVVVSRSL